MARRKSLKKIDALIAEKQQAIERAKARYERLCSELKELYEEQDRIMAAEVLDALRKSKRSYRELMTFLGK